MIKRCAHEPCGETFEAQRRDARYCSASCRAGASRARREGEDDEAAGGGTATAEVVPTRVVPVVDDQDLRFLRADVRAIEEEVEALVGLGVRIEEVERQLGAWEERGVGPERLDELEAAVVQLVGEVKRLREEFYLLVGALGG